MFLNKGDSKITVIKTIPYFIPKTRTIRSDIYFNGDKNEDRMGGLYMISAIVFDENMSKELMSYSFYHLVVDDELSNCLPFVDPGENWYSYAFFTFFIYIFFNNKSKV